MWDDYSAPKGFQFEQNNNNDGPIQNDTTLSNYNGQFRAYQMINHVVNITTKYKATKNVFV